MAKLEKYMTVTGMFLFRPRQMYEDYFTSECLNGSHSPHVIQFQKNSINVYKIWNVMHTQNRVGKVVLYALCVYYFYEAESKLTHVKWMI
jgi:hypothetical protein